MGFDVSASASVEPAPAVRRRVVAASALGNASEWYDYAVYGYVAIEMGAAFFPGEYSTIASLLVFAVSFVLRPLGGIVFGTLGDRIGRNRTLAATIILMCVGTFLIGMLPTYQAVGIWAPVGLVILRVVQGFSTGGEYGGAAIFMAEYAPDRKRGFWGSFLEFGTLCGLVLASVVVLTLNALLGSAAMAEWGWRIPFLLALPLGLVGLYLRMKVHDTPVFRELAAEDGQHKSTRGMFRILSAYWPALLRIGALAVALNITQYTLLGYMAVYFQTSVGFTGGQATTILLIGQVCMLVVIPFAGSLSDRIGRKPCWWISLGGLFVLVIPMFWLMTRGFALAIVAFAILGLFFVLQLGNTSATLPAMLPTHIRYSGMAGSYNISTAALAATAPPISEILIEATGNNLIPAYYLMAGCALGAIALITMPETAGSSLRGRDTPGLASQTER
ncbi:MHS family proline/betaine transporter-like MFS transporter [Tamaricihabitans halophyticus]|uniref:Putative proline/betaine transporter n=1 Tax=Tamaricihabitans halophyticus TaxID=1262583 RepID=A0A4V2SSB6_9PSEU|nr:MFS transporter [Tamaricihabitans halophyticus]TCP45826.1 MHS family proline/betaine transporter-like MFS transporter [Tamaricihabitans halophyticus]